MLQKFPTLLELRIIAYKAASISRSNVSVRSFSQVKCLQFPDRSGNSFQMCNSPIKKYHDQQVIESVTKNCLIKPIKNTEELLADAVTPLWRIPYNEQLKIKDQRNFDLLKKLTTKLKQESPSQILCQLLPTVPSVSIINKFYISIN